MQRIILPERSDWKRTAETLGFGFHSMYGEPYWDESRAYKFTLQQIENDLEDVTQSLYACCLDLLDDVVRNEELLHKLAIPEVYWDWIRQSWNEQEASLYGRFDLLYDGTGPAKMLEFNADTPTALYETGYFQWIWLEQQIERGVISDKVDQYNSVQDKLIACLKSMFEPGSHLHLACCKDTDEDRATVKYIEDCAIQAGLNTHFVYVEDIGIDENGRYADSENFVIDNLFKLYPYEDMFREDYGPFLPKSEIKLIEPPWKSVLSNKGILPLLWEKFPNHPNLLPAYFEDEANEHMLSQPYVKKPLFSREGANIDVLNLGNEPISSSGDYGAEGFIFQKYHPVPNFGDDYTIVGSWIIGGKASGICLREDSTIITKDLSRFVPHFIED